MCRPKQFAQKILNSLVTILALTAVIGLIVLTILSYPNEGSKSPAPMIQEPLPTVTPDLAPADVPTPPPTEAAPTETATTTVTIESDTGSFDLVVTEPQRLDIPCLGKPEFAPDGNRYVCLRGMPTRELWLGSLERGLDRILANEVASAAWSPDGRAIAYIEWVDQGVNTGARPVKLLDLESGQIVEAGVTDFTYRLGFTPDGKPVYHRQGELQVFDPTLRSERAVPGVTVANDYPYHYSEFKFSPDGRRIAVLEVAYDQGALTVVDVEIGQRIKISDQIGSPWGPFDWSPGGRQLAYSIVLEETRFPELWLVNADGSEPRRLCTTDERGSYDFVTWLPNGKAILFMFMPGSGTDPSLWSAFQVVSVLGGEPKTLFTNGESIQLVAQGHKIVFYRLSYSLEEGVKPGGYWIASLSYQRVSLAQLSTRRGLRDGLLQESSNQGGIVPRAYVGVRGNDAIPGQCRFGFIHIEGCPPLI